MDKHSNGAPGLHSEGSQSHLPFYCNAFASAAAIESISNCLSQEETSKRRLAVWKRASLSSAKNYGSARRGGELAFGLLPEAL